MAKGHQEVAIKSLKLSFAFFRLDNLQAIAKVIKKKKLYELARKGITVDVAPRRITIKDLSIQSTDLPRIFFSVTCSKGTYVRQLAVDIGEVLGCGAYLSALRRTRSGAFSAQDACSLEELRTVPLAELATRLRHP